MTSLLFDRLKVAAEMFPAIVTHQLRDKIDMGHESNFQRNRIKYNKNWQ
jgi:hypothetical protein